MTAPHIVDPATVLAEALSEASVALLRQLLQTMTNACPLMPTTRSAPRGDSKPRVTHRNRYRHSDLETHGERSTSRSRTRSSARSWQCVSKRVGCRPSPLIRR